jgi:ornithine carbamoyltransferase
MKVEGLDLECLAFLSKLIKRAKFELTGNEALALARADLVLSDVIKSFKEQSQKPEPQAEAITEVKASKKKK